MNNSIFKSVVRFGIVASLALIPIILDAQNLRDQLQQCPVIIENGRINYYMPQQAGPYFQLPPARKTQYVNIMTAHWVQPLTKSVKETQSDVLQLLHEFISRPHPNSVDKELFLRKLAWCVMLNTSIAKQVDTGIRDYINQLTTDEDSGINTKAALVQKLVNDYRGTR